MIKTMAGTIHKILKHDVGFIYRGFQILTTETNLNTFSAGK